VTIHKLAIPEGSCFTPILDRIREETSKILKIPFERFFTDHSIEGHSARILLHLHGLTTGLKAPLCEEEVYILIAAAYLHDISLAWKNNMTFLELRKNHPKLSGQLIRSIANGEQISGIQCEFGLPHQSSQYSIPTEFIARVVEGHGGTTADAKYADTVLDTSKVRVRFLADLLAFADELDLYRARVDLTRLAQAKMPEADIFHWWKHWFIIGVKVEQLGIVQISYAFPEEMRNEEFPDLVQMYVRLRLQNEYAKVESTLGQEGVNLHLPLPYKTFTPLALPGGARPSPAIVGLFRNAVASLLPTGKVMLEPNEVSGTIELATQYFMDGMLPAVVGEKLYVRRRESEEAFEEFVEHASERLFLLAGRPGTGKTMFVRRMISKYPSFSLFYRYPGNTSVIGDLPQYIVEQYASVMAGKLQAKKYRELDIRKLEEIAKSKGKRVIIFIESNLSLNDLTNPQGLLLRLLSAIDGRNIKVFLSCVADVGETLHLREDAVKMIYRPASRMGILAPSSVLEDYSEEEFSHACIRYFDERRIKASEADFVDEARDRLKNPLWLDIYSMARADYQRTGIETSIRYVEVCESFLTNRSAKAASILNQSDGTPLIQGCLNKMAEAIISVYRPTLDRSTVMENISEVFGMEKDKADIVLDAMKMAGLIKESYYANEVAEAYVRFAFDEIREYLIARQCAMGTLNWTSDVTALDIRNKFSEILQQGSSKPVSPYGVGVLEFLILLLEHAARNQEPVVLNLPNIGVSVVSQLLTDLAESRIELGERVCARVLGRLEECPEDLTRLINSLSSNQHETVRRELTYSLSALSRDTQGVAPNARKLLSTLVDDSIESVASCAVAALIRSFEREVVPPEWIERFRVIGQSQRRGLVTTMLREFGRRSFPNTIEFFPQILEHLCLRKESDYQTAAAACDCLSRKWHLFPKEALFIVRGAIDTFRNTHNGEIVMRQAIPVLISMEPRFQNEVYRFLEDMAKLKRNEDVKYEIVQNYRKLSSDNRENLLRILEKDESAIVKALVYTARNA
jgi:hypothetical protein